MFSECSSSICTDCVLCAKDRRCGHSGLSNRGRIPALLQKTCWWWICLSLHLCPDVSFRGNAVEIWRQVCWRSHFRFVFWAACLLPPQCLATLMPSVWAAPRGEAGSLCWLCNGFLMSPRAAIFSISVLSVLSPLLSRRNENRRCKRWLEREERKCVCLSLQRACILLHIWNILEAIWLFFVPSDSRLEAVLRTLVYSVWRWISCFLRVSQIQRRTQIPACRQHQMCT